MQAFTFNRTERSIPMIAAIYARYSSENQRHESIAAQLRRCREYCAQSGYTIIKEYTDEAYTGTNDQRPAFQQMLIDAERGLFKVVVFHKADRFGRNEYDYYTNRRRLELAGVRIEYADQRIDDTPEGRLSESVIVAISSYYSRNLSREIKKGQKENAYEGKSNGSLCYGYTTDKDNYIIINEYEATAVRKIFSLYLSGAGYQKIVDWLTAKGYRTRRGAIFSRGAVRELLLNRRYIGTVILGKNKKFPNGKRNSHRPDHDDMLILENACPAIIEKDVFNMVQEKMSHNPRNGNRQRAKHKYLLSGKVFCGECGAAMVGSVNRKSGSRHTVTYYRCGGKQRHGAKNYSCDNRVIQSKILDDIILDRLFKLLHSDELLGHLIDKIYEAYGKFYLTAPKEINTLIAEEKKLTARIDKIYDRILDDLGDEEDEVRLKEAKEKRKGIQTRLKELGGTPDIPAVTREQIEDYVRKFFLPYVESAKNKDPEKIEALIHDFIDRVIVTKTDITLRYKVSQQWCAWRDSNARPTV